MSDRTVTVFGASGRQGQAQVRALLAAGVGVRAVSRNPEIFRTPSLSKADVVAADYRDPASLERACAGVDAVFFQTPQVAPMASIPGYVAAVGQAAHRAEVATVVLNSTMWAPDAPCGQAMYDGVLGIEDALASFDLPLVVFRPTLFMDNWLAAFARPVLVEEHLYRYPHRPDLQFTPICLDDLAKFMVAAIDEPALLGQRIRVAGPETMTPADVTTVLSEALDADIRFEWVEPAVFGREVYDLVGAGTGLDVDAYSAFFADFYEFNNQAPQEPFRFDVRPVLDRIPIQLETFRSWANRQNWHEPELIGSASQ